MTREETIQILSILKAAYPNSYKCMTRQEANGVISVWHSQFGNIPVDVLMIAVQKLIATSKFPPTISEVNDKLESIYFQACCELAQDKNMISLGIEGYLTSQDKSILERIADSLQPAKRNNTLIRFIQNNNERSNLLNDVHT